MQDDLKAKLQEYGITGRYESLLLLNKIQSEVKRILLFWLNEAPRIDKLIKNLNSKKANFCLALVRKSKAFPSEFLLRCHCMIQRWGA